MSEFSKITCDVKGCGAEHTEEFFNQGHPGWGHVAGIFDDATGADRAHLCPRHMKAMKDFLNGEVLNNGMD